MHSGIAYGVGYVPDDRRPVATFRLEIRKVDLLGLWVCDRRRFLLVEEWEER
jgi:hypothetical protein